MFVGKQHGKAEEAIRFYTSQFPNSKINDIQHYTTDQSEKKESFNVPYFQLPSRFNDNG